MELCGVSLRYRPGLPLVLRGVSFRVEEGQRVGVVGRTGAGKSTIVHALLRLVELSGSDGCGTGRVLLGGVDTASMGLDELRRRVAVCPQDCCIFSGSLRDNVDPCEEYSDAAVMRVLRDVGLAERLAARAAATSPVAPAATPPGRLGGAAPSPEADGLAHAVLSHLVAEGGSDLSGGERQLLCLARVLLSCGAAEVGGGRRGAQVVVLDEATSVADHGAEQVVQAVVRRQLAGRTVLVIAHRLRSVIDADRIAVMSGGECVEFGSPLELLNDRSRCHFRRLVEQSGEEAELRALAMQGAKPRGPATTSSQRDA